MSKITLQDLENLVSIGQVALSPDKKRVVFDAANVNFEKDTYQSTLFLYDRQTEKLHRISSEGICYYPQWTRDAHRFLFLSKDEAERGDAFMEYDLTTGSTAKICAVPDGVRAYDVGPSDKVLYLSRPTEETDIHKIDKIPFWFNGPGYIYQNPVKLWECDITTGRKRLLVDPDHDIYSAAYSRDGERIAYAEGKGKNCPLVSDIHVFKHPSASPATIASDFLLDPSAALTWAPNDEHVVVQGHRGEKGYFVTHNDVWLLPLNGKPRNLTEDLPKSVSNPIYCDILSPFGRGAPQPPQWDNGYLYVPLADHGKVTLTRIDVDTGNIEHIEQGKASIHAFSVVDDTVVYTKTSQQQPLELWEATVETQETKHKQLSRLNHDFITRKELAEYDEYSYTVSDGETVEGWIMEPADRTKGNQYPTIVWIHGGPKSMLGHAFMFEFQLFAANGFGVIYMNPRGSGGYTEAFADIKEHFGERDYQDLMEVLEQIEAAYPWVDGDRLGVTGISYGGFMANWIVTQTDKFSLAISEEGIADQISFFTNTDIGHFFNKDAVGGDPWNNLDAYIEKSPLLKAEQVDTPIMFIHAMDDYRCWIDQSIQFYTALQYLGKDTELAIFPEGGHVFGWTGKPKHRRKRLQYKLEWCNEYLQ